MPEAIEHGRIVRVTLYRDQGLVTRQVPIASGNGEREIMVGRLPNRVIADSVYAEGLNGIEVRGVRVVQRADATPEQPQTRELLKLVDQNRRKLREVQVELETVEKQSDYIDRLMNFTAVSAQSDLSRGVLDATTLTQLVDFSTDSQQKLAVKKLSLEQQRSELELQQTNLEKELSLVISSSSASYDVTVVVATEAELAGEFLLSYLVSGCGWEPQYTVRGELNSDVFQVRYGALIQQMSGEAWDRVELTLSTTSPGISASGPALTPFRINTTRGQTSKQLEGISGGGSGGRSLNDVGGGFGMGGMETPQASSLQQKSQDLFRQRGEVANRFSGSFTDDDNLNRDLALNRVANEFQNLELQADAKQLKSLAADASEEVSSQTYEIAQPVSLASRREQHTVLVSEAMLSGQLYYVATPLLSSYAFREGSLLNDRPEGLLGGPAAVYLDGRFVGRTELRSTASGQRLIVGFGADQQVRTRREFLGKSDEIQGGNRKLTFQYRLVVANFKNENVTLRLFDRMPLAYHGSDIRIEYDPSSPPLSQDGLYLRVQQPLGVLRWDIEVQANSFGETAHDVDYAFSAVLDRTLRLTANLGDELQEQQDLFDLGNPRGMGGMGGGMGVGGLMPGESE